MSDEEKRSVAGLGKWEQALMIQPSQKALRALCCRYIERELESIDELFYSLGGLLCRLQCGEQAPPGKEGAQFETDLRAFSHAVDGVSVAKRCLEDSYISGADILAQDIAEIASAYAAEWGVISADDDPEQLEFRGRFLEFFLEVVEEIDGGKDE